MRGRRAGFTTRASCLLAAGITAMLCGLVLGEIDLLRAGVLAAAIPCAAALLVHRARVQVANRRSLDPKQAVAGDSVTVNLTITNRARLPTGALMLEDKLPTRMTGRARFVLDSLAGHQAGTVSYRLPALGRGLYRVGPLSIRLADPFHMIDLTRSFTATDEFVVTPRVDTLTSRELPRSDDVGDSAGSHSVGSHGADDASTREYRIGDDLRKIHWRSSARTGQLMVRQEERPWRSSATVVLDLRADAHDLSPSSLGPPDPDPRIDSSLEWAVSAAASFGTQAMRTGREVGLVTDPDQRERLRFSGASHLAVHLAGVRETGRRSLVPLGGLIRTAARESALVAILGRLDPDDVQVLADAQPRGGPATAFALVLDVDSWLGAQRVPGHRSPAEATAAVLRASGWRVTVVTRGMSNAHAFRVLMAADASDSGAALGPRFEGVRR